MHGISNNYYYLDEDLTQSVKSSVKSDSVPYILNHDMYVKVSSVMYTYYTILWDIHPILTSSITVASFSGVELLAGGGYETNK